MKTLNLSRLSLSSSSIIKIALLFFSIYYVNVTTSLSSNDNYDNNNLHRRSLCLNPTGTATATATDLLNILGTSEQASTVDQDVASKIRSCIELLVYNPTDLPYGLGSDNSNEVNRRSMLTTVPGYRRSEAEEDHLISSPPQSVLDLARLVFDSHHANNQTLLHILDNQLNPTSIIVPDDIEGSKETNCSPASSSNTRINHCRRFYQEELNEYMKFLFDMIVSRGPSVGLDVSLNRYDLYHGHLFVTASRRLGILYHAKEYPAFDAQWFPLQFSNCQQGSYIPYDDQMNLRNIVWLAPMPSNTARRWAAPGALVVLDAHPNGIIYRDLIDEDYRLPPNFFPEKLGLRPMDVNYLNVGGVESPNYQLFLC